MQVCILTERLRNSWETSPSSAFNRGPRVGYTSWTQAQGSGLKWDNHAYHHKMLATKTFNDLKKASCGNERSSGVAYPTRKVRKRSKWKNCKNFHRGRNGRICSPIHLFFNFSQRAILLRLFTGWKVNFGHHPYSSHAYTDVAQNMPNGRLQCYVSMNFGDNRAGRLQIAVCTETWASTG